MVHRERLNGIIKFRNREKELGLLKLILKKISKNLKRGEQEVADMLFQLNDFWARACELNGMVGSENDTLKI